MSYSTPDIQSENAVSENAKISKEKKGSQPSKIANTSISCRCIDTELIMNVPELLYNNLRWAIEVN